MGIIDTKLIQWGNFKSLLTPRQNITNIAGLRYLPSQFATDVFEVSSRVMKSGSTQETIKTLVKTGKSLTQIAKELNISTNAVAYHLKKLGLYKPTRVGNTPDIIIDKNILTNLVNAKKSMTEIATELNVPIGKVRYYLEKYNIKNSDLEELEILRKYFSAKTQKDKNEAFAVVDKYLEQIAKEKYKEGCAISYQDFLQDIRLQFLELAEKRENNINSSVRNLFKKIREVDFTQKVEHKTEDLTSILNKADDTNILTENFEDTNFFNFILKNSRLTSREEYIINEFTKNNRSLVDIAGEMNLGTERMRKIVKDAIEKMNRSREFFSSDKYLDLKIYKARRFLQEFAKREKTSAHKN